VTPAPEIVFHRFFQKLLPVKLRHVYRGKQDLSHRDVEPSLGSFLAEVQGVLNRDLQQRNPRFHFDYIDSTEPNALAFTDDGFAFVAITMPLIRELWWISEKLRTDLSVIEVLKVTPTTPEPWAIQTFLFATQLSFVVAHEFAHHERGHIRPSSELRLELPPAGSGSLRRQAQEVDADGLAVYLVLSHLITGARRDSTRKLLVLDFTDAEFEEILLVSVVMAIATVFSIFPARVFDQHTLYQLPHPPQAVRIDEVMRNIKTWCSQNRPDLGSCITPMWFQRILHASLQNGARTWASQVEMLRPPVSASYFTELHAQLIQLLND
jgi:hypothetical protein